MTSDHGGENLNNNAPERHLCGLIETYTDMQARAVGDSTLLAALPRIEVSSTVSKLVEFLEPTSRDGAPEQCVKADYFLGSALAKNYHRAICVRSRLLEDHVVAASEFANTLNHGGLRPTNCAITASGQCILYSWGDASCGPAGLSLHALFSGCLKPSMLLDAESADTLQDSLHGRLLKRYIDRLASTGYSDEATLRRCLSASIVVGVMQYLCSFAHYQTENDSQRETLRDNIRSGLRDLLDLCDYLSSKKKQLTLDFSENYGRFNHIKRAESLLQSYLSNHRHDATAIAQLGKIRAQHGNWLGAKQAYQLAL